MKGYRRSSATVRLLALLVLLGGFGAVQASAQSYVFNANTFATGKSPEAVVSADFNGDGQPDVAAANQGANSVSILIGNKDATFQPHVDYGVGTNPVAIVAADFNGDGKPDLAVANSGLTPGTVSVLIGNGDGTFVVSVAAATAGNNPQSIASADVNGDGNIDLVVANFSDNTVSVLLGNGDGTFNQAQSSPAPTGTGPTSVAIGDFNGDGKLDLVTADKSINSISVLLGNGDGTFQSHTEYATGRNPVQVVVGDFNNDGKPDVAAADGGDGNVSILINSGNSKLFPTVTTPAVYTLCTSLVVGDFNGDHNLDLAVSSAKSNSVAILLGLGTGQFQTQVTYSTGALSGGSPNPVAAADFNGDGHLDLVFANPGDSDISVLLNNGSGVFSSTVTVNKTISQSPISLAAADFDGDGNLDLATVAYNATASSSVSVLLGNGDGTFKSSANYPTGNTSDTDPQFVVAADFNGDGKPDLAIANFGDNTVSILLNNGDGTFPSSGTVPTYATGFGPTSVAVGDFNGDGKLDLAVGNASAGTVSILLGNGNGTFQTHADYSANGTACGAPNPSWIVAADVHDKGTANGGNGFLDLVIADTLPALAPGTKVVLVDCVSVLFGNGDGSFKTATQYSTGASSGPSSVVVGDFNDDGMPDLATADSGNGDVSVLLNIGSGTFGAPKLYTAGLNAAGIAAGDLNGDGKLDLIAGTTSSFANTISTLLGNGDGTFQSHVDHATGFTQAPNRRQPVIVADFNNDTYLDVAVSDETTPAAEVYLNQPQIAFSPGTLTFGSYSVGSSSPAQTVTITNIGTAPITLTSLVTSGDFGQTNTCPTSSAFAQAANCTVSVTFTPAASGTRTGSLTVTDDVPVSPQVLALSGTGVAPAVTLSSTSLTFSGQNVGTTSAAQTVTLTNSGSGTLTITSIAASAQFGQTNTCGSSVAQSANCTISVTFSPTASGTQTGTITITDNASGSPQKISLTGTGNGPAASLSPTSVTFSSQPVGSTSPAQVVTLTNTGNQTLSVTQVSVSGPFAQSNNCTSVAANSSCTLNVTFKPTASASASGTLTITDNAAGSPQTVTLSGTGSTGPFASASPASLTFATTNVGSSSSSQTVTLTNTGNAALSVTGIAFTGANAGDFSESGCGTLPLTLPASGGSCGITVTFKPTAAGNRTASLTVTDNSNNVAGSTQSVSLTGTGNQAPVAAVSPTSLNFGSQTIDTPAPTQTVALSNTGNATLTVTSIAVSGNSSYTQTNTCGSSVSAGASCKITVTFTPSAGGTLSGTLTITDDSNNVAGSMQTVSLTGTGTGPFAQFSPTNLSFGGVLVSGKSTPQTLTLSNGGTSALTISSSTLTITGAAATEFTQTNNCPGSLAAGSSCTITVTFAPTAGGTQNASLTVSGAASNGPVPLSGAGSNFSLSPPTNSTQTISAGSSAAYTITLSPNGGFNQTVSLSCSSNIPAGSCSVAPTSLTLNAPNTAKATVTVNTTAAVPPAQKPSGPRSWPLPSLWLGVLASLAVGAGLLGRRRGIVWRTCLLAGALSLVLAWAACGGGGSSSATPPSSTSAGTYTITVTASSPGVPNSTTSVTLIVQ